MPRTKKTIQVEPVPKRWLNKKEAMKYLGCGEDFLDNLRNNALIHFYRFGKVTWYELKDLDQFILRNKVI